MSIFKNWPSSVKEKCVYMIDNHICTSEIFYYAKQESSNLFRQEIVFNMLMEVMYFHIEIARKVKQCDNLPKIDTTTIKEQIDKDVENFNVVAISWWLLIGELELSDIIPIFSKEQVLEICDDFLGAYVYDRDI